jgi:hypothetical protein
LAFGTVIARLQAVRRHGSRGGGEPYPWKKDRNMNRTIRTLAVAALPLLLAGTASCATFDPIGDVLGGGAFARDLTGEVRGVDTRRQTIDIRTRDGRSTRVAYDRQTRVEYRGRYYAASALERGDVVSVRLRRDRRGRDYADRVVVRQNARDTHDRGGRYAVHRFEGTVTRVDERRGTLEMHTANRRTVQVVVPSTVDRRTHDRFRRLRRGERVRVEVRETSRNRYELRTFR